jgi:hypothetical protein
MNEIRRRRQTRWRERLQFFNHGFELAHAGLI